MSCLGTLRELKLKSQSVEEARAAIASLSTVEVFDSDFHRELAKWAEELDEPAVALREWNLTLRDEPQDEEAMARLVEGYLDTGSPEKAHRFAARLTALNPQSVSFWAQRVALERELGRYEEAVDSCNRAYLLTQDVRFQAPIDEPEPEVAEDLRFDDTFLILMQELFRGREGVYARQWVDEQGRTGYSPIREPLSLHVLRNHLHGNHTLGVYPLRMDNTVHFAALDFDLAHVVTSRCTPGSKGWSEAKLALERFALAVRERAAEDGVPMHLADSGYKGCHLWLFFSEPVPGRMARSYLKQVLAPLAWPPVVQVEVFPKQSTVPATGLGNLIKIPLGIHRKSGQRVWFSEPQNDLPSHREFLQNVTKVDKEVLTAAFRSEVDEPLDLGEPEEDSSSAVRSRDANSPSLGIVWEPDYQIDNDRELQIILGRCVTLRTLVEQVRETAQMSHDEARVLIHTLGHLVTGPLAVNTLLSRCMESDSSLYLRRPLRGNPMSCPKIRARIPEMTSALPCDCIFSRSSGLYPTPTLHLHQSSSDVPLDHLQFQALLQDFLRTKKELFRLRRLLEVHSERLSVWFDQVGQEEMETSLGRLRRLTSEDGHTTFELTV